MHQNRNPERRTGYELPMYESIDRQNISNFTLFEAGHIEIPEQFPIEPPRYEMLESEGPPPYSQLEIYRVKNIGMVSLLYTLWVNIQTYLINIWIFIWMNNLVYGYFVYSKPILKNIDEPFWLSKTVVAAIAAYTPCLFGVIISLAILLLVRIFGPSPFVIPKKEIYYLTKLLSVCSILVPLSISTAGFLLGIWYARNPTVASNMVFEPTDIESYSRICVCITSLAIFVGFSNIIRNASSEKIVPTRIITTLITYIILGGYFLYYLTTRTYMSTGTETESTYTIWFFRKLHRIYGKYFFKIDANVFIPSQGYSSG